MKTGVGNPDFRGYSAQSMNQRMQFICLNRLLILLIMKQKPAHPVCGSKGNSRYGLRKPYHIRNKNGLRLSYMHLNKRNVTRMLKRQMA